MDRPLGDDEIRGRTRTRVAVATGAGLAAVAAWFALGAALRPSVSPGQLRTGTVDLGPLKASLSVTGTVVPDTERVLASPIDARVLRVLKRPGAAVKAGEAIVELDTTQPALAADRLRKELRLKEAQTLRAQLTLEGTVSSLESQVKVRDLTLSTYGANLERNQRLFAEGLISEEVLRQSELDEARTRVELAQLHVEMRLARRSAEVERSSLEAELGTARQEAAQAERELALAATRSDRDGVVTFVVSEEGAVARRGEVLARVADLITFRVEALVPDVHASRVAAGQEAIVRVDSVRLAGRVTRVQPAVRDGQVTVSVSIDEKAHAALRPNLRVDVELVTDTKDRALRLPRGSFGAAEGGVEVWVLKGGEAVKTRVRLGVSNADHYEAVAGLAEGDVVVLSEMADYAHLSRMRLRGWKGGSR